MPPLSLTDDELASLSGLAAALPAPSRDAFLRTVAANLAGLPAGARGPGLLYRVAREVRLKLLRGSPVAMGTSGKYGKV